MFLQVKILEHKVLLLYIVLLNFDLRVSLQNFSIFLNFAQLSPFALNLSFKLSPFTCLLSNFPWQLPYCFSPCFSPKVPQILSISISLFLRSYIEVQKFQDFHTFTQGILHSTDTFFSFNWLVFRWDKITLSHFHLHSSLFTFSYIYSDIDDVGFLVR